MPVSGARQPALHRILGEVLAQLWMVVHNARALPAGPVSYLAQLL